MRAAGIAILRALCWAAASILVATGAVSVLEGSVGVENASIVYLVAVVVCGLTAGTAGAIIAAILAFLVYNWFFTPPLHTLTVADPQALLGVVLLLFTGIVVGQLAAAQRARARAAEAREREARALFGVSRVLATRESTDAALAQIAEALRSEAGMSRVWVGFGPDTGRERPAADTDPGRPRATGSRVRVLQRRPGDEPAAWSLVVMPATQARRAADQDVYRVRIEASGEPLGSIWAERERESGQPTPTETRLIAGAADQVGQAVARDRVAAETRAAEVARQADALKSSLLQSVSHDFRTPLAVIRAAAGSLDDDAASAADRHANAAAIEQEVEYLNALVTNLLDLSRIEAGALRADRDVYELDDAVRQVVDRHRSRLGERSLDLAVEPELVLVDGVFLESALANLIENALKYTPPDASIRISSVRLDAATVRLLIEDGGPGVPDDALPHVFEKFYRAPGTRGGSRAGTGIGLAVVKGLIEATGGRVEARRSDLGGLAVALDLPLAPPSPVDEPGAVADLPDGAADGTPAVAPPGALEGQR